MKIKFKFDKKAVALILVCIWGIFAVWYVLNDQWQDFKMGEREEAYKIGKEEVIKAVVEGTSKCEQQIPVSYEDKTVNIVSVECLQKPQQQPQPSVPVTPTSQPVGQQQ